jgi:hypothetical protein
VNVTEEINGIAVALCKSENMRVTAGQKYAALWRFVTTPGTDGAQQVIDAGHEPTQYGLWEMIIAHPSYPNKLGTSFSAGKRLLSIGAAPDPWQTEREERQARAKAERDRREAAAEWRAQAERARRDASFTKQTNVKPECNKEVNPGPEDFLKHPACQNVLRAIIACPPEHWEPLGQYIIAKYRHLHGSSAVA